MSLYFEKETAEELSFDYEKAAIEVIDAVMNHFQCPYEYTVNVYLIGPEEIQEINASYRGINKVTDVLSFPNISFEKEADFSILDQEENAYDCFDPDSGELLMGDILICQKQMCLQAGEYGHSELREFAFLVAHSMLHLLGFDHMQEDERIRMENLQDEILNLLGITRD